MKYGFKAPQEDQRDWKLGGGNIEPVILQPNGQWDDYLPSAELQYKRGIETQSCVSFGTNNCLESLIHRKGIALENFSDRFLSIVSGTDPLAGNDPKSVIEAVRKIGGIAEAALPFDDTITSVEQFFTPKPMTDDLLFQAKYLLQKYAFNYEWVWWSEPDDKKELLKKALWTSPVGVSVRAWKKRDLYYKEKGEQDNHFVMLFGYEEGKYWKIYDSYDETVKHLEWDYDFNYAMRYFITGLKDIEEQIGIIRQIMNFLREWFRVSRQMPEIAPVSPVIVEVVPNTPFIVETPTKPETLQEMAKRVCKEAGLNQIMTDRLLAVIKCESGWDKNAIHKNKDGTRDCGLVQLNEKWYLKPNHMTCQDAIDNPEKCVKIMATAFRNGNARDWICYRRLFTKK